MNTTAKDGGHGPNQSISALFRAARSSPLIAMSIMTQPL